MAQTDVNLCFIFCMNPSRVLILPLGLVLFFGLQSVVIVAEPARDDVAKNAQEILETSIRAPQQLKGYYLRHESDKAGTHFQTQEYVMNLHGKRYSRIELTVSAPQSQPYKQITISSPRGVFRSLRHSWAKLTYESGLTPLSARFKPQKYISVGQQLGVTHAQTVYTVEHDITFFGTRCTRITASLEPAGISELREKPYLYTEKLESILRELPTDPKATRGEKAAQLLAIRRVYVLHSETGFLLSARSFSLDEDAFTHFTYTDFTPSPTLTEENFSPPPDAIVKEVNSPSEFQQLLGEDKLKTGK